MDVQSHCFQITDVWCSRTMCLAGKNAKESQFALTGSGKQLTGFEVPAKIRNRLGTAGNFVLL